MYIFGTYEYPRCDSNAQPLAPEAFMHVVTYCKKRAYNAFPAPKTRFTSQKQVTKKPNSSHHHVTTDPLSDPFIKSIVFIVFLR